LSAELDKDIEIEEEGCQCKRGKEIDTQICSLYVIGLLDRMKPCSVASMKIAPRP
jgi:hypothetical protein